MIFWFCEIVFYKCRFLWKYGNILWHTIYMILSFMQRYINYNIYKMIFYLYWFFRIYKFYYLSHINLNIRIIFTVDLLCFLNMMHRFLRTAWKDCIFSRVILKSTMRFGNKRVSVWMSVNDREKLFPSPNTLIHQIVGLKSFVRSILRQEQTHLFIHVCMRTRCQEKKLEE